MKPDHPTPIMERAKGEARVALSLPAPGTAGVQGRAWRIDGLRQQGSAKAILPHAGPVPEVVFLNTSGGLTGGDRLSYTLSAGAGLRAIATTQTAERAYRAGGAQARMDVDLSVAAGGWLDWLPQETILFDASALSRRTRITLGPGAGCIALEAVILGRHAMGEVVNTLSFRDRREIWQDNRLVHLDPVALDSAALGAGAATLGQARAFANIVMLGTRSDDLLAPLRAVLDEPATLSGASAYDGRLVVRIMAADGWPLRRQIVRALTVLRRGAALPRVWQM